jgi:hypothetical protein
MTGFSADWLALRESADAAAKSAELIGTLPGPYRDIVDLGSGAGANFRWLAPRLEGDQRWMLVDNDARLLVAARKAIRAWAVGRGLKATGRGHHLSVTGSGFNCTLQTLKLDLNSSLTDLDLPRGCLVTASALFDLVSRDWLEKLVARIAASGASVLWSLNYDGRVTIDPASVDDETVIAQVNRHQLTDKGFGPALGPDAWLVGQSLLEQAGYRVRAVDSSWRCGKQDSELVKALIAGWSEAALAISPKDKRLIEKWSARRLGLAAKGKLRVAVGHRDMAAWPEGKARLARV